MNKTDFIANAAKIISQIAEKLNISEEQAQDILAKAKDIIGGGIMDKIKNPFGGQ